MFTVGDLVEFKFGVGIHRVIHVTSKEIGICGAFATYYIALDFAKLITKVEWSTTILPSRAS